LEKERDISKLEQQLKNDELIVKNKQKASDQFLKEANERLKNALHKGDLVVAQIAQSMLEAAKNLRIEEPDKEIKTGKIQSNINKRKSKIINEYITKQKK